MNLDTFLPVFTAVVLLITIAVAAMAIGVIMKRPCLRGSCGGQSGCAGCANREHPPQ